MKKTSKDSKDISKKRSNTFLRFSNLTFQMGVIIGLSAWGGMKLDEHFKTKDPYFTIVLSLIGIGIALYVVLRDVVKNSNDEQDK
jgi:F0F1-type ATP synthase assembly protein I